MVTVAITGASSGIGLELCRQLAARGETVYALVRKTNTELENISGNVTIIPDIDVARDAVVDKLSKAFEGKTIDVLVNNAGGYGGPVSGDPMKMFASQSLDNITTDVMLEAFQLNTLGPLRVTKALVPLIPKGGKVAIISSLMGSIEDNTSGGSYAYRTAKAAVNMLGKSLAGDLKGREISVSLIHPGMVKTGFAKADESKIPAGMLKMMRELEPSVKGVVEAIDAMNMENTGTFVHGNYGEGLKPCLW